jgi:hypothetical protein
MKRAGVLAVVVALACCAPARADLIYPVRVRTPDGRVAQPFQRWADRAKVPTAATTVVVHQEPCPGAAGSACYTADNIYESGVNVPLVGRFIFLHELGHAYDAHVLSAADRARFQRIMRLGGAWGAPSAGGAPSEQFADAYAHCALWHHPRNFIFAGRYLGYAPTPKQYRRVCAFIHSGLSTRADVDL